MYGKNQHDDIRNTYINRETYSHARTDFYKNKHTNKLPVLLICEPKIKMVLQKHAHQKGTYAHTNIHVHTDTCTHIITL